MGDQDEQCPHDGREKSAEYGNDAGDRHHGADEGPVGKAQHGHTQKHQRAQNAGFQHLGGDEGGEGAAGLPGDLNDAPGRRRGAEGPHQVAGLDRQFFLLGHHAQGDDEGKGGAGGLTKYRGGHRYHAVHGHAQALFEEGGYIFLYTLPVDGQGIDPIDQFGLGVHKVQYEGPDLLHPAGQLGKHQPDGLDQLGTDDAADGHQHRQHQHHAHQDAQRPLHTGLQLQRPLPPGLDQPFFQQVHRDGQQKSQHQPQQQRRYHAQQHIQGPAHHVQVLHRRVEHHAE